MSARVFIHPRCLQGPAHGALLATLEAIGLNGQRLSIYAPGRRAELVRVVGEQPGGVMFERFDGHRFHHRTAPEAA